MNIKYLKETLNIANLNDSDIVKVDIEEFASLLEWTQLCLVTDNGEETDFSKMVDVAYHNGKRDGCRKGREKTLWEYQRDVYDRTLYELTDILADLNKNEILSHDDIDEWLKVWKTEMLNRILKAAIDVRKEKLDER